MFDVATLIKITSLAAVDAINVCAFAVLTMVLTTILIQHPEKPKKVLTSGLAFIAAIFITYTFYAFVIVQFLSVLDQNLKQITPYMYKGLAMLAMVIGALNIKDFFMYKKGGIATEMPIWMRPKVKRIIQRITSPKGAFVIGILVTLFLLTCTVWPLFIAAGELAHLSLLGALPWFLYYNLIFVSPMLAIVFLVYLGFTRVQEVSGWKDKHVKLLHLIAGLLLFSIGVALLMGWL
jgi:cytochrome c biogenesis protein CcdA